MVRKVIEYRGALHRGDAGSSNQSGRTGHHADLLIVRPSSLAKRAGDHLFCSRTRSCAGRRSRSCQTRYIARLDARERPGLPRFGTRHAKVE